MGVSKILYLHTQVHLYDHLAICSSMLLQGQILSLVNRHICRQHILPQLNFLLWGSTKHNGNIDIFTSFNNVCGSNHTYWTIFMTQVKKPQWKRKFYLPLISSQDKGQTFQKRKGGISQFHSYPMQGFGCLFNIKQVQNHRLIRTQHDSPCNHWNNGITYLPCWTKSKF